MSLVGSRGASLTRTPCLETIAVMWRARGCLGGIWLVWASTLFASTLLHSAVEAQAPTESPELALSWDGSGCGSPAKITARVEQLLRRPLARRASRSIRVRGTVEVTSLGRQLTLTFSSRAGVWTRRLTTDDCEQLIEATALVLALAIEPERATELMAAAESAPEPEQSSPEHSATDEVVTTQASKARHWTAEVGAGAALSSGCGISCDY